MIYKCENCANRGYCINKIKGYKDLCNLVEAVDKVCYYSAYYSLSLKCDYWVEDKEEHANIGEVESEKGGTE